MTDEWTKVWSCEVLKVIAVVKQPNNLEREKKKEKATQKEQQKFSSLEKWTLRISNPFYISASVPFIPLACPLSYLCLRMVWCYYPSLFLHPHFFCRSRQLLQQVLYCCENRVRRRRSREGRSKGRKGAKGIGKAEWECREINRSSTEWDMMKVWRREEGRRKRKDGSGWGRMGARKEGRE